MSDRTWAERFEDWCDTAASAVGFLSLMAVILAAVWGVTYCLVNHITVRDIGHTIISFVDDGKGDETGFVQAMRSVGYNEDANAALDAGHKMCSRLRSDGSTPTDIANWMESNRPAGIDAAIWRKMTFDLVTNAQVYLCPDTLHNTGTPTPTTVTVTSTAPVPTATRAPTAPPTMVATTTAPTTPFQPDWAKYCREHPQDWVECGETGPNPVPSTPGGSLPPTPNEGADESPCRIPTSSDRVRRPDDRARQGGGCSSPGPGSGRLVAHIRSVISWDGGDKYLMPGYRPTAAIFHRPQDAAAFAATV